MTNETPTPQIERTNGELRDLKNGPSHRGALESVDTSSIVGWCLEAASPLNATAIEISCSGILLARTLTSAPRGDLAEFLGAPSRSGFRFNWIELSFDRREQLIARLATLPPTDPVDVRVRIAGLAVEVDAGVAVNAGTPTNAALLKSLRALAARPARSEIAVRQELLGSFATAPKGAANPRVRTVAFYLPQFHPIPENDEWWGKGFTEWSNVAPARPSFDDHDQPRLPSELGYYDLRTPGVIEAQIELARSYGLTGFCFHHYWFGGQRLLQKPLERFLEIDHDFGFCICWANEAWSRRWDGSEHEVLMPQPHSTETDTSFINDVLPILQDRRYIRVGGKPILIVYRVGLFKEPRVVFDRWRQICVDNGLPGLHICMAETFGARNPWQYGCDSAVEFPPHNAVAKALQEVPGALPNLHPDFKGNIYDYREVVANQLMSPEPEYPVHPTVMLGWDNTSRRGLKAHVFHHFSSSAFETWLENACQRVERDEGGVNERLVFINAWNEWGEGTYLEPDRANGRQHLESVRRVVMGEGGTESAFEVLRQRLKQDKAATAALDRIAGHSRTLQSMLTLALQNGRSQTPFLTRTCLTTREPIGVDPSQVAGRGHLDHVMVHSGTGRLIVRRGEIVHCNGWAVPVDRALTALTPSYIKLSPLHVDGPAWFGALLSRNQRSDVAQHFLAFSSYDLASLEPVPSGESSISRTARSIGRPRPALTEDRLLWCGFAAAFATDPLEPGRYAMSVIYPSQSADQAFAVDVFLEAVLEVAE